MNNHPVLALPESVGELVCANTEDKSSKLADTLTLTNKCPYLSNYSYYNACVICNSRTFIQYNEMNFKKLLKVHHDDLLSSLGLIHVHCSFDIDVIYVFAGVGNRKMALY